ncbi:hypothetical protein L1887_17117 [Cichorium endivia]|nr:hypothetical protein L1887_17117 [Cichorium endivia]
MPHWPLNDEYIHSRTSTEHICIIKIPPVSPPLLDQYNSSIEYMSIHIENHKPMVKQTLQNLLTPITDLDPVPFVGLLVDMFCTSMIDVANDLHIPCYLFFAFPKWHGLMRLDTLRQLNRLSRLDLVFRDAQTQLAQRGAGGGGFLATGFEKPVYTITVAVEAVVVVVKLWVRCGLFEVWLPGNWVCRSSLEASSRGTDRVFRCLGPMLQVVFFGAP